MKFLREAFSSMGRRAKRKAAVDDARYHLDLWADYADPAELGRAIAILRGAEVSDRYET